MGIDLNIAGAARRFELVVEEPSAEVATESAAIADSPGPLMVDDEGLITVDSGEPGTGQVQRSAIGELETL